MERNLEVESDLQNRPLRSLNNYHPSYVRFHNKTHRHVRVYWLDFKGKLVQYCDLYSYQKWIDVNTFVTHPWIFVDEETGERLLGDRSLVFFPAVSPGYPERIVRTRVEITLPLFTLTKLCLRVIKQHLSKDQHAFLLEIPRKLQYDLALMKPRLGNGESERTAAGGRQ